MLQEHVISPEDAAAGVLGGSMQITTNQLDFVTIEGLLAYAEEFARAFRRRRCANHPLRRLRRETGSSRRKWPWTVSGVLCRRRNGAFPAPPRIAAARRAVLEEACGGDELVFYAAWNRLVAEGALQPLLRAPIGSVLKPAHRRPVAIVPRAQLTPQLAEGRIVLDLGDDRFWLLPRDLADRTLLFTMRHGISRVESKTHRVGRRLANQLDEERGVPRADAVGSALARMVGVVGQQLDFLHLTNYLDPAPFPSLHQP